MKFKDTFVYQFLNFKLGSSALGQVKKSRQKLRLNIRYRDDITQTYFLHYIIYCIYTCIKGVLETQLTFKTLITSAADISTFVYLVFFSENEA